MRSIVVVSAVLALASLGSALQIGARAAAAVPKRCDFAHMSSMQSLVTSNKALVDSLATIAPEMSEVSLLRFALGFPDAAEAKDALREAVEWRKASGRSIVESAATAVAKATSGGAWDNAAVRDAAPYAAAINQFITPKNIVTINTEAGDLVYVIRASLIDDKGLMSKVTVDELVEFLLYVKEVHSLVANARSEKSGRLCNVVFANDISGTRKPPDPQFSKALTASSKSYERLYPSLAGPTMILNLPGILLAFIGLFKPLFPKTVQERLKFESAPYLAKLSDLTPLTTENTVRSTFLAELKLA